VEHYKEDAVLQVTTVDDLCDKDSNRLAFSFNIKEALNLSLISTYTCRVSKTNNQAVRLLIKRHNDTNFSVFLPTLPPGQESLFNFSSASGGNLVVEILCSNADFVTHKRTVDLKICATRSLKIKDMVALESNGSRKNDEDTPLMVKFNSLVNSTIVRLKPVDAVNKSADSYVFSLASPNEFIDVHKFTYLPFFVQ
jgi:hypothetical protein